MAYMCKKNYSKECDGCGACYPPEEPETGVIITATIEIKMESSGYIEEVLRKGDYDEAVGMAEAMLDDRFIDEFNLKVESMDVNVKLKE